MSDKVLCLYTGTAIRDGTNTLVGVSEKSSVP